MSALDWPTHPAAGLFPLLEGDGVRELADDIRENGLYEPLWLWTDPDGCTWLLDGRNRLAACRAAGVTPTTRFYDGADPIGFVVSENVKRRHLTAGQRAFLALDVIALYEAEAAKRVGGRPRKDVAKPGADLPQVLPTGVTAPKRAPRGQKSISSLGADLPQERTQRAPRARDKAARTAGASGRAVAQAKRIDDQAPDLATKVRGPEAIPTATVVPLGRV